MYCPLGFKGIKPFFLLKKTTIKNPIVKTNEYLKLV